MIEEIERIDLKSSLTLLLEISCKCTLTHTHAYQTIQMIVLK